MFPFLKSAKFQQQVFAFVIFLFAGLAMFQPFLKTGGLKDIGGMLVIASILIFIQGFKRSSGVERNSAHTSAFVTFLLGILLLNNDVFEGSAIYLFTILLFLLDATRQLFNFIYCKKNNTHPLPPLMAVLGNLFVVAALIFFKGKALDWLMAISGSLRLVGMGIEIIQSKIGVMSDVGEDVVASMGFGVDPAMLEVANQIEKEEETRAPIDRYWIITFLLILFFIHLGRMGFDRSASGLLSPIVALIGDIVIALIIAFVVIIPLVGLFRKLTGALERLAWNFVLKQPATKREKWGFTRIVFEWLTFRMRREIKIRKAGYSFKTALRTGLQMGLPYAALLAAIIPVFGMSWYFDTENWASGIWDSWAAKRADVWRTEMVKAIVPNPGPGSFFIHPPGVNDSSSFSFIVLGDPGEGDASQYILHDQLITNTANEKTKFLVISSDVVYPDGAMKDYERNFWLPMKGVHIPVYAIPGNHDWYDALEGFAATFYDQDAAQKSMRARREVELKLTTAVKSSINSKILEAERLRNAYRVPTGYQQAPYFQLQTKDFAFITVETGVQRRIDDVQMDWLKKVLEAAQGKFIFVLLGHPFYAIGEYQGSMNPDFQALHELLRKYHVNLVMAGDTHDLEYYLEPLKGSDTGKVIHHFVNGGGGAYLSLGAALKPNDKMPEKVWAHYPSHDPLMKKIEQNNNWLKKPAWIWTKRYNGWPFSAEWLSAAFDYNNAPFFQSYFIVEVNPMQNKIQLHAMGVHGPLHWNDLDYSKGILPQTVSDTSAVIWTFPLHQ